MALGWEVGEVLWFILQQKMALPPKLTSGFLRVISMLAAGPKPVRDLMWICVGRGRLHWQYTENAMDFKY